MGDVVSLGSVNVDHRLTVSDDELAALEARYDWVPDRGQTVRVDDVPEGFAPDADETRHGGKGANQAVAAARAGASTTMLGAVGDDYERHEVVSRLDAVGVDTDRLEIAAAPTGAAYVFVEASGDNRIVVCPGANDAVDEAYVRAQQDAVADADCLLLQNEIPVGPVASLLDTFAETADPPTVILDPAPPNGVDPLLARPAVDYCTPNEHEYTALESTLDAFDGVVVHKRGGNTLRVETSDDGFTVDPPSVDPTDTTGAGDVLNGFLAARLAAGAPLREAVELAVTAGSMATRTAGAQSGVPTLDEVRAFRADS